MTFGTLSRLMYRGRWYVVGAWMVALIVALIFAYQVGSVLGPGTFTIKHSDSDKAAQILNHTFHQDDQKVTLVVLRSPSMTIDQPAFRRAVATTAERIRADRGMLVTYLDNPLVTGNRQLIANDRHGVALLLSSDLKEQDIEGQIDHLRAVVGIHDFTTYVTGTPATNHDSNTGSQKDIAHGTAVTLPILLVILVLVFGSLTAAGLPLLVALFSIPLMLAGVYAIGHVLDTSIYVANVVQLLGLGISIDYSLFIVYRFREELLAAGGDVEAAIVRTMQTTGRAIFFSGITVAIALSSLSLTGVTFLVSMGIGGLLVPLCALLVALTLLPAVLGILGKRVNRLRVLPRRFLRTGENGLWHRLATVIMDRPILTGGAALALLLAVAFPVTQLHFSYGSLKNADTSEEAIRGYIVMRNYFPSTPDPTQIVVQHEGPGSVLQPQDVVGLRRLEAALRRTPEVRQVIGPAEFIAAESRIVSSQLAHRYLSTDGRTALITVIPRHEAGTRVSETMVRNIRKVAASFARGVLAGNRIYVGGAEAGYLDWDNAVTGAFPVVVGIVLLLTAVFLFFAFRSVFLPLKAVLLNLLSVGAAYGAIQLVFQRGIGSGLLAFSPEDGVATWVPIFLFAFLFGLSMDYEVFLISRIREGWLTSRNNRESVAFGLEKTGRLISSAALIMIVAYSGFLVGHQIQFKEFGVGLIASIALDASLIRLVLVPSIMELVGDWNWWVPARLRGFAGRAGSLEGPALPEDDEELAAS